MSVPDSTCLPKNVQPGTAAHPDIYWMGTWGSTSWGTAALHSSCRTQGQLFSFDGLLFITIEINPPIRVRVTATHVTCARHIHYKVILKRSHVWYWRVCRGSTCIICVRCFDNMPTTYELLHKFNSFTNTQNAPPIPINSFNHKSRTMKQNLG